MNPFEDIECFSLRFIA